MACLWAFGVWAGEKAAPDFAGFPVKATIVVSSTGARPILDTPRARRYRSVIAGEGVKAANFAGHYRLVVWGCGTDCRGFTIVDRQSGRVYLPPGIDDVVGVMGNADERVDFRQDSRLLILTGSLNDGPEGKFFYEWTGRRLKLIRRLPVPKESFSDVLSPDS